MKKSTTKTLQLIFMIIFLSFTNAALACSRSLTVNDSFPFNHDGIPNSTRIKIASMAIDSKLYPLQFPGVKLEIIVIGGAYIDENHPRTLARQREESAISYLVELGFKRRDIFSDIYIQPHTRKPKSEPLKIESIVISFNPTCADGQSGQGDCNFPCTKPEDLPKITVLPHRIEKL